MSYCHELTFRTLNPYSKVSVAQVSEQEPSSRSNFVSAQALHTLLALHPPKHDASQHWVALPALHPAVPQASAHSAFGHSSPGASPTTVLTLPLPPTICAHVQVWACGENMQRAQQAKKFRVSNAQDNPMFRLQRDPTFHLQCTRNTQSHKRMRQCAVGAHLFADTIVGCSRRRIETNNDHIVGIDRETSVTSWSMCHHVGTAAKGGLAIGGTCATHNSWGW
jgi:hypothetical protein